MNKEKFKKAVNKLRTLSMLLMTGLMLAMASPAISAQAGDEKDLGTGQTDVETIINSGKTLEESSLKEFGAKADDIGGGAYNLTYKIGVWVAVIVLMVSGIALMFSNAGNRNEAKNKMIATIVGALFIFAAVGLVAYLQVIGAGLFS